MCGMAGAFCGSTLTEFEIKRVSKLLILNHFRGDDSTGMFDYIETADKEKVVYWKKKTHPVFFAYNEFGKTLADRWKNKKPNIVAVHARAATIGSVTAENAHPFVHDHIIGMHNGTINKSFKGKDDYETDSEALIKLIATDGIKQAVDEIGYGGAYALVWFDMKDYTLNFLRNSQRPLHFVNYANTLYWSSDKKDLAYALECDTQGKLDNKEGEHSVESGKIFELPEALHIKFDANAGGLKYEAKLVRPSYTCKAPTNWRGGSQSSHGFFQQKERMLTQSTFDQTGATRTTFDHKTNSVNTSHIDYFMPSYHADRFETISAMGNAIQYGLDYVFCIENGLFYSKKNYAMIQEWRANFPREFVRILRTNFEVLSTDSKKFRLAKAGLSKNQYKELIKGKDTSYIYHPYHLNDKKEKVYNRYIIDGRYKKIVEAEAEEVDDLPKNRRINNKLVSIPEYLNFLDNNSCAHCGDFVQENEDVLWTGQQDFVCETCQENAIREGTTHLVFQVFPNLTLSGVKAHVNARKKYTLPLLTDQRNVG